MKEPIHHVYAIVGQRRQPRLTTVYSAMGRGSCVACFSSTIDYASLSRRTGGVLVCCLSLACDHTDGISLSKREHRCFFSLCRTTSKILAGLTSYFPTHYVMTLYVSEPLPGLSFVTSTAVGPAHIIDRRGYSAGPTDRYMFSTPSVHVFLFFAIAS